MANGLNDAYERAEKQHGLPSECMQELARQAQINLAIKGFLGKDDRYHLSAFVEQEIVKDVIAMYGNEGRKPQEIAKEVGNYLKERYGVTSFKEELFTTAIGQQTEVRNRFPDFPTYLNRFATAQDLGYYCRDIGR